LAESNCESDPRKSTRVETEKQGVTDAGTGTREAFTVSALLQMSNPARENLDNE